MTAPKISIIVPVFQAEATINRCILSIIEQTFTDWELLLIDDGSTDASPLICEEAAKSDARIRVLHTPNKGVSSARNHGLDLAQGSYIAFADSDDWLEPCMLECLLKCIKQHGTDIAACGYVLEKGGKCLFPVKQQRIEEVYSGERALLAILKRGKYRGFLWNKLFRAELLKKGRRLNPEISVCEDFLLCFELLADGASIVLCRDALYHYVSRQESLSASYGRHRYAEAEVYRRLSMRNDISERTKKMLCCREAEASLNLLRYERETDGENFQLLKRSALDGAVSFLVCRDIELYDKLRYVIKLVFRR